MANIFTDDEGSQVGSQQDDGNHVDSAMAHVKLEEEVGYDSEDDQQPRLTNGNGTHKRSPSTSQDRDPFPPKDFKPSRSNSSSATPIKKSSLSRTQTPLSYSEETETVGGDTVLKQEPGEPLKLARTKSRKVVSRPAPLFLEEEDVGEEACQGFTVIPDCEYQNKTIGQTSSVFEDDEVECECEQAWDPATQTNSACDEDSDCINRVTKIECIGDCRCGAGCQNRRFQLKQYASVTVFKTDKKGYGLRADTDMRPNDFVYEYIGEVISEGPFQRRRAQYDKEKIKHFYFMSLSKGEFIDATKKGNLGRFCNHSCNPNCHVDKWMVRDKLRMGIFALRPIKAGEELTFDYNVDRYGADPQPCYCGEPNCSGFLGGKTQTDRGTKLAHDVVEALGIEDGEDWDMAVPSKKKRKQKTGEADEEYVGKLKPKQLQEDVVSKVMAQLMQKKEKWIVVKLLQRIQDATDETVFARVVKMHGYRILKSVLASFQADANVCLQVFDILTRLPRMTRNKIHDSKIEEVVQKLQTESEDDRVKESAAQIQETWGKLEMGYRIPKKLRDANDASASTPPARNEFIDDRRGRQKRDRSESRSPSPRRPIAPTGPKNMGANVPRGPASFRGASFASRPAPPPNAPHAPRAAIANPLPDGWTEFFDKSTGKPYYHSADGQTSWTRPTQPANIPPPPPKPITENERLQQIINECISQGSTTPTGSMATIFTSVVASDVSGSPAAKADRSKDGWGSWPIEKCKKQYKGLIAPLASRIASKYKDDIPKDRLKEWIKEITAHITDRHFDKHIAKNVKDLPRDLRKKTEQQIKEFFEKAQRKFARHAEASAARKKDKPEDSQPEAGQNNGVPSAGDTGKAEDETEQEVMLATPDTPAQFLVMQVNGETSQSDPPPPPPPPPPPLPEDEATPAVLGMAENADPRLRSLPASNGAADPAEPEDHEDEAMDLSD